MKPPTARLLIWCPDGRGIIAAVTGFLAESGANILEADQHSDPGDGSFCMRVEFETEGIPADRDAFVTAWSPVAERYAMDWRIAYAGDRKRMAVLVSRQDHCLHDLLLRQRCREIDVDIPFVVSNHDDLRRAVTGYGINFHHLPITPKTKPQQEQRLLELLADERIDFVVLARYMQILTAQVVDRFPSRIINIHHGFLPAFAGARPYHQAYERGVKLVGATAHYVTSELDAGPIISQQTLGINHRDTVDDLIRKGRDLERNVLADAVRVHVADKVLVHHNKTIVFD
jgi:formyltetrahydrofolate deformylase